MTAPWCPESGRPIKYVHGHRVKCDRCGKRVLVIGYRLTSHRLPRVHGTP